MLTPESVIESQKTIAKLRRAEAKAKIIEEIDKYLILGYSPKREFGVPITCGDVSLLKEIVRQYKKLGWRVNLREEGYAGYDRRYRVLVFFA